MDRKEWHSVEKKVKEISSSRAWLMDQQPGLRMRRGNGGSRGGQGTSGIGFGMPVGQE